jgi:hypothetical protein
VKPSMRQRCGKNIFKGIANGSGWQLRHLWWGNVVLLPFEEFRSTDDEDGSA